MGPVRESVFDFNVSDFPGLADTGQNAFRHVGQEGNWLACRAEALPSRFYHSQMPSRVKRKSLTLFGFHET